MDIASEMRKHMDLVEFSHSKPKPAHKTEFEDWERLLGKEWTDVQEACMACGSYSGLGYLVRDIDWFNICPAKYNTCRDDSQWEEPADEEERWVLGDSVNRNGGSGLLCLSCFDGYAAAADMDYEITMLFFNGLRQSFTVNLPDGIAITKHSKEDMHNNNIELKTELRHPDRGKS